MRKSKFTEDQIAATLKQVGCGRRVNGKRLPAASCFDNWR